MFVKNVTMSGLVGTGDNFWAAMYFLASTFGFLLAYALVQVYYVKPHNVVAWWYLGLLFMLCMAAGVALPGGLVVLLWHLSEKRRLEDDKWDAAASQSPRAEPQTAPAAGGDDDATPLASASPPCGRPGTGAGQTSKVTCYPETETGCVAISQGGGVAAGGRPRV